MAKLCVFYFYFKSVNGWQNIREEDEKLLKLISREKVKPSPFKSLATIHHVVIKSYLLHKQLHYQVKRKFPKCQVMYIQVRYAYYQNVMHYSAYRGISIECDCINVTFYDLFSERCRDLNAGKKAAKGCRNFGFDSLSRQFIFNALG